MKIDISQESSKKNFQNKLYHVIRLFVHEVPTIVGVLRDLTVRVFEHLNITSWDKIDCRQIYFEQLLRGPDLKHFWSALLSCNEILKEEAGENRTLGNPEDVNPEELWALWKADSLDEDNEKLSGKDLWIDLDQALWFLIYRSMWKKHHSVFNEHTRYVNNYIKKPWNMGILFYSECLHETFELEK